MFNLGAAEKTRACITKDSWGWVAHPWSSQVNIFKWSTMMSFKHLSNIPATLCKWI